MNFSFLFSILCSTIIRQVSSLFEKTNARIYQAFKGIDNLISQDSACTQEFPYSVVLYGAEQTGAPTSGASEVITPTSTTSTHRDPATEAPGSAASPSPTWASAYSKWILGKIASNNNLITSTASVYSAAIPTEWTSGMKSPSKVISAYSEFISNFNDAYKISDLTFPTPTLWPDTPINIQKRQGQAACQQTQTPAFSSQPVFPYSIILYGASSTAPITPPPTTVTAPAPPPPTNPPIQCPNGATDRPECAAAPSQPVQTLSIARSPLHASPVDIPCATDGDCVGVVCDVDSAAVCSNLESATSSPPFSR